MAERSDDEREEIRDEFEEVVNMTAKQLEEWLESEESQEVGQKDSGGESTGHEMGRRIVEILGKNKGDYDEDDHDAMNKVVGYVHRHLKQGGPDEDKEHSRWRYSLMNWGHDPLKD